MKKEWRKHEKEIYLPKDKPVLIEVPKFKYFSIEGSGNPNDEVFTEYIGVLYSLAYAVRMSPKAGIEPEGYYEYTVYPLEGIWDICEEAKNDNDIKLNKDNLVFNLMIRQPDFVTPSFAKMIIEKIKQKKPHELLNRVKFISIEEGKCVQMMHLGSYDDEIKSFEMMNQYCKENNLERISMKHREIYLNDARKTKADKLKTVLRYKVKGI